MQSFVWRFCIFEKFQYTNITAEIMYYVQCITSDIHVYAKYDKQTIW